MSGHAVDAADEPAVALAMVAPPHWRSIDFISDLHLAEDTPRGFDVWASYLRDTDADAVFILGDLFDAWPGDDARIDGFEARCAEVLKDAAARRFVGFMPGNRDFLVGPALLADCGVQALADPTRLDAFGGVALLSHGDAWCVADTSYQQFRRQVRTPAWMNGVLARTLPERRALARHLREQSELQSQGRAPGDWADVDPTLALRWMRANAATSLVHGHTHRPASEALAPGVVRHVLSDWELDHEPAATRAEVLRWQADGFARLSPLEAASPPDRA